MDLGISECHKKHLSLATPLSNRYILSSMGEIAGFQCVRCQAPEEVLGRSAQGFITCPSCHDNLQVIYDYASIRKKITREKLSKNTDFSIWRYFDLLPLQDRKRLPPQQIGWTPLYPSTQLGKELGLKSLYFKDDSRNPSASFKDRASAIVLAHALEQGTPLITGASTGNAASSLACLAAPLKMKTVIFVPESAPQAKITQLLIFGAHVIAVQGNYDQAFELCLKASQEFSWYNRNTGVNPFTREGKKTCAFEIIEQLGWNVPDVIFIPTGDGNILSGIWKGLTDFKTLGLIQKLPKLVAVQGGGSDAIHRAFSAHRTDSSRNTNARNSPESIPPASGSTVADSISVSIPKDATAALQALHDSQGWTQLVSDEEILAAIPWLGRSEGIFAEPAAAASVAGLQQAVTQGRIQSHETVVALITGSGLKDISSAMKSVSPPLRIPPDLDNLRHLRKQGVLP